MPHLVQGHMRFTESDFLYSDFNEKILKYTTEDEKETPTGSIIDTLHDELEYLNRVTVNYNHLPELFDDSSTTLVKEEAGKVLAESLEYLLTLARKHGFTLEELIKITNGE